MFTYEVCERVAEKLRERVGMVPEIAIICGSGLGKIADFVVDPVTVNYKDIDEFPKGSGMALLSTLPL